MPGSCNQLLLFTDRKGNHKSSEWHWGLESFAPFPTKQVVYMRELCLENPRDKRSLMGCCLWGHTELDMTEAL